LLSTGYRADGFVAAEFEHRSSLGRHVRFIRAHVEAAIPDREQPRRV
jgi:hypothetical protein